MRQKPANTTTWVTFPAKKEYRFWARLLREIARQGCQVFKRELQSYVSRILNSIQGSLFCKKMWRTWKISDKKKVLVPSEFHNFLKAIKARKLLLRTSKRGFFVQDLMLWRFGGPSFGLQHWQCNDKRQEKLTFNWFAFLFWWKIAKMTFTCTMSLLVRINGLGKCCT